MTTNQMTTLINNIIDVNINNFIMNISKQYKIDQKELQDLWLQTIQNFQTEESKTEESKTEESKTEESKTEESKTEESKTEESSVNEKHECSYKFTRGKNKGQICGTKTKEEFCSKHRKVKKKTKKNNVPVYQNPVDQIKPQDTSDNELKSQDTSDNELKSQDTSDNELKNQDTSDNELKNQDTSDNELKNQDTSDNESNTEDINDISTNNLTYDEVEDIINEVLNN